MPRLDVYEDGTLSKSLDLVPGTWSIGRDAGCEVVLKDPLCSRHHAELASLPGSDKWVVRDLGGENGTRIDGVKEVRKELAAQAVIQVGTAMLVFDAAARGEAPLGPPDWAHKAADDPATAHMPPAMLARLQSRLHGRAGPHLVKVGGEIGDVYPLNPDGVVDIGYGPRRVKLPGDGDSVVAEVRGKGGRFVVTAPGFLSRVDVNGKKSGKKVLATGDEIRAGDVLLQFQQGLLQDATD